MSTTSTATVGASVEELQRIADRVVAQAGSGEQVEAYVGAGTSTSVDAYLGEVESLTQAGSSGIGRMKLSEGSRSRIGIITTKKLGNAVERNRARRLIREAFRLNQHELSMPVQAVFVARNSITKLSQREVTRDYLSALKKAGLYRRTSE